MTTGATKKKIAASFSILSNSILIALKFVAGIISGSISIISEAIHSMSDLLASFLAFFSVIKSAEPADADHQYGHGKYEDFSGLLEGFLIILASFFIIYEAGKKIITNSGNEIDTTIAIAVMGFSVLTNIFVSTYLYRVAKKTDSIALFADAEHLKTDVYSSLAVLAGLCAIKITGISLLDPLIAIMVAILIMKAGFDICKKSANNLLDGTLPKEENEKIQNIISNFTQKHQISFKNIKTRKSGMNRQVEFTLLVNADKSVKEGHSLCDAVEKEIMSAFSHTSLLVHIEPLER